MIPFLTTKKREAHAENTNKYVGNEKGKVRTYIAVKNDERLKNIPDFFLKIL